MMNIWEKCDGVSFSVMSDSSGHGLQPTRLQNSGVGDHSLLQGIVPIQRWNQALPRYRQIAYSLNHQRSLDICANL